MSTPAGIAERISYLLSLCRLILTAQAEIIFAAVPDAAKTETAFAADRTESRQDVRTTILHCLLLRFPAQMTNSMLFIHLAPAVIFIIQPKHLYFSDFSHLIASYLLFYRGIPYSGGLILRTFSLFFLSGEFDLPAFADRKLFCISYLNSFLHL